jgi:hypothetical protein
MAWRQHLRWDITHPLSAYFPLFPSGLAILLVVTTTWYYSLATSGLGLLLYATEQNSRNKTSRAPSSPPLMELASVVSLHFDEYENFPKRRKGRSLIEVICDLLCNLMFLTLSPWKHAVFTNLRKWQFYISNYATEQLLVAVSSAHVFGDCTVQTSPMSPSILTVGICGFLKSL